MIHSIKCKVCGSLIKVNGQKQISTFVGEHKHDNRFAGMTGENVELDNHLDRIQLKIEKPDLITGNNTKSVRDYWRKVPGAI